MKEPYRKGRAGHPGPESCADGRKARGEALTGENTGPVSSCEIRKSGVPTPLSEAEGHIEGGASREPISNPAQSQTRGMCGNSSPGNREIPRAPEGDGPSGRSEKAQRPTSDMHAPGKSDSRVVPEKRPNKGEQTPAEVVEGRRLPEGNPPRTAAPRTQRRTSASPGLARVREVARRDRRARFTALLHHVTVDLLRDSFFALKREASPGIDGVTWGKYEVDLEAHLRELHEQVHQGTYRAQPSKRAYIPKADGKMRPLGIAALEDKIVQMAVVKVLEPIYEEDFLGFSYGFRPGRNQHQALDALVMALMGKKVNWVLDADIRGFFDSISHEWMLKFLQHRIADPRILRLVQKWLRAGVSEDGIWSKTEVGTPQGAVISPLLANVFLHYVLDLWVEQWRKNRTSGDVIIVRYADDFVMGFQHRTDAERFLKELRERMCKFGLALHPEKTRLIEFGRFAAENRKNRGERKPETFDFLGFTHICWKKRVSGGFIVKRKTAAKRLRAKLKAVREALLVRRHWSLEDVGGWVRSVVQGFFNYHAVPGNAAALGTFRREVTRSWLFALRRRSQRSRMTWKRFWRKVQPWVPRVRILHPHSNVRFFALHPR